MLTYHRADERPYWQSTVTVNGTADDMSSGYTFTAKILASLDASSASTTKTSGITGATGGVVTVAWSGSDLDLAPGNYIATLTAKRTSDNAEWTITEPVKILARP